MKITDDHAAALADATLGPLRPALTPRPCYRSINEPAVLMHERVIVRELLQHGLLDEYGLGVAHITPEGRFALKDYESARRERELRAQRRPMARAPGSRLLGLYRKLMGR